ncbi:MAG TPA: molybdopterin-dependent oxidoreductase [Acidimicrobiales bacterium]|nr:molybdopterin-dependent oxidoreductase [Acidimicrobiales bacterium]
MAGIVERIGRRVGDRLGLDHGGDRYTYVDEPGRGPVSASRAVDRWVRTTCGYCSVGCGMRIGVRDGRAVAVEGDPGHPVNRGRLCPKGLSEHHMLAAEGRLTVPRVDGRRASWDEAIGRVVDGFGSLLAEHGPESVAVLSTGQLVTEEFYALGKLARLGMGLHHYDGNTTLCMSSAVAGYKLSFGTDGPPGCYDDLALADVLVLWGANLADNHPLLVPRVVGEGGPRRVIVVDPRVTKTAMIADTHLPVRPRGDVALLNGVLVVLVEEGLVDPDGVRDHVDGIDDLLAHLAGWTVERAAAESGIGVDAIRDLARAIAGAERCTIAWTMGVNHSVQGTLTVTLINTVALLTGHVGRPGASPFSITGQCNAMGTREAGFTASMPGYRAYDDPAARAELAALLGVDEARLPATRGKAYPDIVNAVMSGHVKGLWVIATNPLVSFPNREVLEHALSRLDLLVVQDGFETPTTALADVVLPAAVWGEKDGTYTNSERRVSRVRAAVEPPGEARSDLAIFLDVARRWGCADELFPGWTGPADAFEEWRRVSAGRPCDYSGITADRLDAAGGVQWPCPEGEGVPLAGTARLYGDKVFNRPNGRALVLPVDPEPLRDAPRPEFPFLLNTGRTVEHWHTRTKTGRIPILEGLSPEAWVEVHPSDAARLGVRGGDWVRVASSRGAVEQIRVRVTAIGRPGEVFIPFHWDESCANRLTDDQFDPISREPNYKQCAVKVERLPTRMGR